MRIHIYSHPVAIPPQVHAQTLTLLRRTLESVSDQVVELTVDLRHARGTRGDGYTHCRIVAALQKSQRVIVERIDADQGRALAQASLHLARAVQHDSSPRHLLT
jgi:hypothetical protein